ncbi:MAG: UDP-N-acetylmuramate--L-alanine ligase [Acidimicrobiia bacterium]|nr:UDP-N-acetylmuramate--L-alanine ligase [Acidimicrobiia bacterium]
MGAIASVLAAMGHRVSGSDLKDSVALERLRAQGVTVHVGHDAANVGDVDAVAVSTAIPAGNPEVRAATERGIEVLRRAEILTAIAATRRTVAVSGTHGKTTTSSMLALVLVEAGMRPSFIVGGELNEIGSGAVWSDGEWFVVEADESDGTFVEIGAEVAVVTSIEADHLDFYGDLASIEGAFDRFLSEAPGPNLVCADDPGAARLGRARGALTYGTDPDADYRIVDPVTGRQGSSFQLAHGGEVLGTVELPVPGLHNIRNATAAIAAGLELGAPFEAGRSALARYAGVARRFQFRGEVGGITVVDDYAHNPGKVRAVLAAAAAGGWARVVAVFQPHRYSRTADLHRAFGDSFVDADVVVLTDVYGAGEQPRPGVTGKLIVNAVLDAHPRTRVVWLPRRDDIAPFLAGELRPGDLCLTLGAGDITSLPDELLDRLEARAG